MIFSTPYTYLNWDQIEQNVQQMVQRLNKARIDHWPHSKTHKSAELAKLQLSLGAKGITVAKLSEAEAMADEGIDSILIAYTLVGEDKWNRLQRLAERASVRTVVDSVYVAKGLSDVGVRMGKPIEVLIEIDGGSHRGGVQPGSALHAFARFIRDLPGIRITGAFAYFGQIYGSGSEAEIRRMARMEADLLLEAKRTLQEAGLDVSILSGGSTPSSFHADQLAGVTESRAGNYIFGDMNAVSLGVMKPEECALRVRSTVVSTPLPGYATIDAGSKTLTSDLSVAGEAFGCLVGMPEAVLYKLNEEHGYIRFDPKQISLNVGDRVEIIPNHSCVLPNLNYALPAFKDGAYWKHIRIDARGRNY